MSDRTNAETVLDVCARYLIAEGATTVFGIPGGLLHPFFDRVERSPDFRLVVAKHEGGAAFMADGFARASGRLAVCASTSGPGATNLLTGVACAFADGVPMIVLTGQAPTRAFGRGAAQETTREDMDIVAMFRPVTKYSAMVESAGRFAHHLRRALRLALSGRPGPVHLNVPVDVWLMECDEGWFEPATYRTATRTFDRRAVARAGDALFEARFPVILAGGGVGVAAAEDHLRTLAELIPARVATTPRGKGLFPEDHGLSLGVMGVAGHRAARETILGSDVDVLLTVGASLNETTTLTWSEKFPPQETLIQLDVDPDRIGRNYPVDIPLVGDAQTILHELTYHLHRRLREGRSPASRWVAEPRSMMLDHARYDAPALRTQPRETLAPQRWRALLQDLLPEDAVIFSDVGGHMLFNIHDLRIGARQRFHVNLGFASMGHGTVAPIGAALALPGRPVLAVIGDACFAMNGLDLLTAAEYDVPVLWIIENNQMHGITWHASPHVNPDGRRLESIRYRRPIEVSSLARAMGLHTSIVTTEDQLAPAVEQALRLRAPSVIEVRVDPEVPPPMGVRAASLAEFVRQ